MRKCRNIRESTWQQDIPPEKKPVSNEKKRHQGAKTGRKNGKTSIAAFGPRGEVTIPGHTGGKAREARPGADTAEGGQYVPTPSRGEPISHLDSARRKGLVLAAQKKQKTLRGKARGAIRVLIIMKKKKTKRGRKNRAPQKTSVEVDASGRNHERQSGHQ